MCYDEKKRKKKGREGLMEVVISYRNALNKIEIYSKEQDKQTDICNIQDP